MSQFILYCLVIKVLKIASNMIIYGNLLIFVT